MHLFIFIGLFLDSNFLSNVQSWRWGPVQESGHPTCQASSPGWSWKSPPPPWPESSQLEESSCMALSLGPLLVQSSCTGSLVFLQKNVVLGHIQHQSFQINTFDVRLHPGQSPGEVLDSVPLQYGASSVKNPVNSWLLVSFRVTLGSVLNAMMGAPGLQFSPFSPSKGKARSTPSSPRVVTM